MTPEEAAKRLVFHGQPEPGAFLEMLRPYRGLRGDVLHDVMACLRASAPLLVGPSVSRELASALWAISHLGRSWALDSDGMLRRNGLIADHDRIALGEWLERFEYAVMTLLEGGSVGEAFQDRP